MRHRIPGRDEVIRLALAGHPPRQIAAETGLSVNTIYCDLSAARKAGRDIPRFPTGRARRRGTRTLAVPAEAVAALAPAARVRGVGASVLAERLLARIARDGLVDAVLDDGGRDD